MSSILVESSEHQPTDHRQSALLHRQLGSIGRTFQRWSVQVETRARSYPLVFAVGIVTLLFAAVIWAMPPAYQTNDDALMNMIAAGQGIVLEPDEHLVCTNVIIGKLLKTLYTHYPGFLWYGWYLVATQWIATVALLYCFLQTRYSRLRVLFFLMYFFTAGIYFLVNLQFTSTGTLSCVVGVMLLLQLLRKPWPQSREKFALSTLAAFFLVWGGLIRSETFLLTVLLAIPVLLTVYWFGPVNRQAGLAVCCTLSLAFFGMFIANRYNQASYSEPAWQTYWQYMSMLIKFNDQSLVQYTPESKYVFDRVGWSENDCQMMLENWYFDDPIYDLRTLNTILTSYPWMQDRNFIAMLSMTLQSIVKHRTIQAICCCLPLMLLFLDRSQRWPCFVALVMAMAVLPALIILRKTPPERVFLPILNFPWLFLLSTLALQRRGSNPRSLSRCIRSVSTSWQFRNWSLSNSGWSKHFKLRTITLLLIIGLSVNMLKMYGRGKGNTENACHYEEILADLRSTAVHPACLIVTFPREYPFEYKPALFNGSDYKGLHFLSFGWPLRSPFAESMKKHFNITTLGKALAEKRDILLIMNDQSGHFLKEYLAEHYSDELRMLNLKNYPRCSLFKFEHLHSPREKQGYEPATLFAKPTLDFKNSQK